MVWELPTEGPQTMDIEWETMDIEWVGSSKEDLKALPVAVRSEVGFALYQAQTGSRHRAAKPLKGLAPRVLEVVSRYDGDTYRTMYTVAFEGVVYVLHAFQKKAKRGVATPKREIDLTKGRLKAAERHYTALHRQL